MAGTDYTHSSIDAAQTDALAPYDAASASELAVHAPELLSSRAGAEHQYSAFSAAAGYDGIGEYLTQSGDVGVGAVGAYYEPQPPPEQMPLYAAAAGIGQATTPQWLVPVLALGGIAIVLGALAGAHEARRQRLLARDRDREDE